jgi:hypothetical protein
MKPRDVQEVIEIYRRRGIPELVDTSDRVSGHEVTWRYADGSQEHGSSQNFQEERDLALTMEEAGGNPLAEAYYARMGHTLKEIPLERAAERERLWRGSARVSS